MILFVSGMMLGACVGVIVSALLHAGRGDGL